MYFILSGYWCARKHLTFQLTNAGSITNIISLPYNRCQRNPRRPRCHTGPAAPPFHCALLLRPLRPPTRRLPFHSFQVFRFIFGVFTRLPFHVRTSQPGPATTTTTRDVGDNLNDDDARQQKKIRLHFPVSRPDLSLHPPHRNPQHRLHLIWCVSH